MTAPTHYPCASLLLQPNRSFRPHARSHARSLAHRLIENKWGLRRERRLEYGFKNYCSYLASDDSDIVKRSEAESSLFSLIEGWLERTPFLSVGHFRFWIHYQDAVAAMLAKDRADIVRKGGVSAIPSMYAIDKGTNRSEERLE